MEDDRQVKGYKLNHETLGKDVEIVEEMEKCKLPILGIMDIKRKENSMNNIKEQGRIS